MSEKTKEKPQLQTSLQMKIKQVNRIFQVEITTQKNEDKEVVLKIQDQYQHLKENKMINLKSCKPFKTELSVLEKRRSISRSYKGERNTERTGIN